MRYRGGPWPLRRQAKGGSKLPPAQRQAVRCPKATSSSAATSRVATMAPFFRRKIENIVLTPDPIPPWRGYAGRRSRVIHFLLAIVHSGSPDNPAVRRGH